MQGKNGSSVPSKESYCMPRLKDMPSAKARAVLLAADIVGGVERLAPVLDARDADIESWLEGSVPLPEHVYQQCVDIVVASLLEEWGVSSAKGRRPLH